MRKYVGNDIAYISGSGLAILPFMLCILLLRDDALYVKAPALIAALFLSYALAKKLSIFRDPKNVEASIFLVSLSLAGAAFYSLESLLPYYIFRLDFNVSEKHVFIIASFLPLVVVKLYRFFAGRGLEKT